MLDCKAMTEEPKKHREKETTGKTWDVIPYILERLFGTVESFAGRLLDLASSSAEGLVNRSVQKLFTLLLLGMGIVFFLSGGAAVINHVFALPGIGQMVIGLVILFITSLYLLLTRRTR